jgi:hypothetical protein
MMGKLANIRAKPTPMRSVPVPKIRVPSITALDAIADP